MASRSSSSSSSRSSSSSSSSRSSSPSPVAARPVVSGSASQKAGITGYTSGGGAIYSSSSGGSSSGGSSSGGSSSGGSSSGGSSAYKGVSVVDYLKSTGQNSSYSSRSGIASGMGITNYSGTAAQNTQILNALRSGSSGSSGNPTIANTPFTTDSGNSGNSGSNSSAAVAVDNVTPENTATLDSSGAGGAGSGGGKPGASSTLNAMQAADAQQKELDAEEKRKKDEYERLTRQPKSQTEIETAAYQDGGVDRMREEAEAVNNQLTLKMREKELLARDYSDSAPTAVGAKSLERQVHNQYARELADLSISANMLNGRYERAKEYADRKVELEMEEQNNLYTNNKRQYELSRDVFDGKTQEKLDGYFGRKREELDSQELSKKEFENIKLQYVKEYNDQKQFSTGKNILKANSMEELTNIIGQSGGNVGGVVRTGGTYSSVTSNTSGTVGGFYGDNSPIGLLAQSIALSSNGKWKSGDIQTAMKGKNESQKLALLSGLVNIPAAEKGKILGQAASVSDLDHAIALLDSGVNTGRLSQGKQYITNLAGKDVSPELQDIKASIVRATQKYRNSVTGAAWGTQETGEYNDLYGNIGYSPTDLKNRLVNMRSKLVGNTTSMLDLYTQPLSFGDGAFSQSQATQDKLSEQPQITSSKVKKKTFLGIPIGNKKTDYTGYNASGFLPQKNTTSGIKYKVIQ